MKKYLAFVSIVAVAASALIRFTVPAPAEQSSRSSPFYSTTRSAAFDWPAPPQPAYTVVGRVIEVYDGDTLTVEVKQVFHVRLLDCWAPEIRGPEKAEGELSATSLRSTSLGKGVILSVPWTENLSKSLTFARVLGHVWLEGDKQSLSEKQVKGGFATRAKKGE